MTTDRIIAELLLLLIKRMDTVMAQIDDLAAALATATTDTQTLIADVAAEVAALKAALGTAGQPVDLTAAIASANALDAMVKAADPGPQPAPATP